MRKLKTVGCASYYVTLVNPLAYLDCVTQSRKALSVEGVVKMKIAFHAASALFSWNYNRLVSF